MPILSVFFGIIVRMWHDDHPPPQRFADRIATATVDSALAWLQRAQLAAAPQKVAL